MANRNIELYNWGNNCKVMKMTKAEASQILDSYKITDQDECDMFFEGFVNGQNEDIVTIHITQM